MKLIIFDFWGTIVENGIFPSPIRQVKSMLRLNMPFSEYVIRFEKVFMLNRFEDLYEGFRKVCEEFKIEADEELLGRLVGMWNKNKLFAKPYPETKRVLEELKKEGYKLALIANTECFSINELLDKFELKKYFDIILLSYEEGMLKTEIKTLEKAIKKMKIKKEESIVVGDSMESDVKGAQNAGLKAVLVDRKNRREFEPKVNNLGELKEVIKNG